MTPLWLAREIDVALALTALVVVLAAWRSWLTGTRPPGFRAACLPAALVGVTIATSAYVGVLTYRFVNPWLNPSVAFCSSGMGALEIAGGLALAVPTALASKGRGRPLVLVACGIATLLLVAS